MIVTNYNIRRYPAWHRLSFRFSTKYEDSLTGDLDYGYRDYDSKHGRWRSRDLLGEDGGENLYAMISNRTLNSWDELGLCSCCTFSSCYFNCINANGGTIALAALGLSGPFSSVPYPGNKMLLANSTNPFTSVFSMITRPFGFAKVARAARITNPAANIVSVASIGYLTGLSITCSLQCASNCDAW